MFIIIPVQSVFFFYIFEESFRAPRSVMHFLVLHYDDMIAHTNEDKLMQQAEWKSSSCMYFQLFALRLPSGMKYSTIIM